MTREGESDVSAPLVEPEGGASSGGRGRKLQEPDGRLATSENISAIRRCWILVSCKTRKKKTSETVRRRLKAKKKRVNSYQLRVELGQTGLALIVKDEKRIDHGEILGRRRIKLAARSAQEQKEA